MYTRTGTSGPSGGPGTRRSSITNVEMSAAAFALAIICVVYARAVAKSTFDGVSPSTAVGGRAGSSSR